MEVRVHLKHKLPHLVNIDEELEVTQEIETLDYEPIQLAIYFE